MCVLVILLPTPFPCVYLTSIRSHGAILTEIWTGRTTNKPERKDFVYHCQISREIERERKKRATQEKK